MIGAEGDADGGFRSGLKMTRRQTSRQAIPPVAAVGRSPFALTADASGAGGDQRPVSSYSGQKSAVVAQTSGPRRKLRRSAVPD